MSPPLTLSLPLDVTYLEVGHHTHAQTAQDAQDQARTVEEVQTVFAP